MFAEAIRYQCFACPFQENCPDFTNRQAVFSVFTICIGMFLCDAGVTSTLCNIIQHHDQKAQQVSREKNLISDACVIPKSLLRTDEGGIGGALDKKISFIHRGKGLLEEELRYSVQIQKAGLLATIRRRLNLIFCSSRAMFSYLCRSNSTSTRQSCWMSCPVVYELIF